MPFSDVIGHERPKAILTAALRSDRLAHAYLFHGDDGIGKRLTAVRFAQAINCETEWAASGPDACGACRSCRQTETLTHPDFFLIEPDRELANPQIKIEQVREIEQQVIYRPLVARRKITLIDEADRLTTGAANALLKTLEEPPGHSLFLLVSSRPAALLPTVRSRCQAVRFAPPARTQVEAAAILKREVPPAEARFLAAVTEARIGRALQADATALRAARDDVWAALTPAALRGATLLLAVAETLHRSDRAAEALEWIAYWVRDVLLTGLDADPDVLLNPDRLADLREAARSTSPEILLDLLERIDWIQRAAARNLNQQLALETVLLGLRGALQSPA